MSEIGVSLSPYALSTRSPPLRKLEQSLVAAAWQGQFVSNAQDKAQVSKSVNHLQAFSSTNSMIPFVQTWRFGPHHLDFGPVTATDPIGTCANRFNVANNVIKT